MRIGVHLPQWGDAATRDGVLAVARAADDAGLDSVWVADHVVHPTTTTSRYPYRSDGVPFDAHEGFLEALTMLAAVAGATDRVGLGTSVLVLTMREPLLTAKVIATLDVLSSGRVTLAVGAGWWKEEFEALGQRFAGRGARFDEQLEILRTVWREGEIQRADEHYSYEHLTCRPLPARKGGPPLLIGGSGERVWRRAARLGDGWHAVGHDVSKLAEGRARMDREARAAGRDPRSLALSTSTGLPRDDEAAIDRLQSLIDVGVDQAVLNVRGTTAEEMTGEIRRLATHVRPALQPRDRAPVTQQA